MNNLKVLGNQKREKILAEKSSFIVASSDLLYQRNLQYNPNTFMMENGFSRKLFHESRNGTVPSDISLLKKPIVGYIGNLKHWLDYELIDYIISKKPEWTFLFVGEVRKEGKKEFSNLLRKHKNIYSTGWIHYRYFPLYLKQFDVGIIPFNTNAFMESANPNKLYDYMGAGVPVVATSIGDLKKKYSYFVKVAQTKEDFLGYLETILNMPADERQALRSKILSLSEGHSWEDDAEFLFEKMKEYLLK